MDGNSGKAGNADPASFVGIADERGIAGAGTNSYMVALTLKGKSFIPSLPGELCH